MSIDDMPDDFSELMQIERTAGGSSSQLLRETVLASTTGVLRFRRRAKRVAVGAALVGCYLAGIATMSIFGSPIETVIAQQGQSPPPAIQKLITPEDDARLADEAQSAAKRLTAYDRLRRTADRQLEELDDIPAAAKTYRKALQIASKEERAVAPDRDTWLLLALKNSDSNSFAESIP